MNIISSNFEYLAVFSLDSDSNEKKKTDNLHSALTIDSDWEIKLGGELLNKFALPLIISSKNNAKAVSRVFLEVAFISSSVRHVSVSDSSWSSSSCWEYGGDENILIDDDIMCIVRGDFYLITCHLSDKYVFSCACSNYTKEGRTKNTPISFDWWDSPMSNVNAIYPMRFFFN